MINKLDQNGIDFLCQEEGFRSKPYLCPANRWTIGIGTTILPDGIHVNSNTPAVTKEIALQYVNDYLEQIYKWLYNNLTWQPNQNQFNALCSFLYNLGIGNHLNACPHTKQAIINGDIPNIITGIMSVNNNGLLTNRRKQEIAMFNSI
jgi:GH24 family phage-related lysozyme (muramidase)